MKFSLILHAVTMSWSYTNQNEPFIMAIGIKQEQAFPVIKPIFIISLMGYTGIILTMNFPCGSAVKNLPAIQEMQATWVRPLGWDLLW